MSNERHCILKRVRTRLCGLMSRPNEPNPSTLLAFKPVSAKTCFRWQYGEGCLHLPFPPLLPSPCTSQFLAVFTKHRASMAAISLSPVCGVTSSGLGPYSSSHVTRVGSTPDQRGTPGTPGHCAPLQCTKRNEAFATEDFAICMSSTNAKRIEKCARSPTSGRRLLISARRIHAPILPGCATCPRHFPYIR